MPRNSEQKLQLAKAQNMFDDLNQRLSMRIRCTPTPDELGELVKISGLIEYGNGFDSCTNDILAGKMMLVVTEVQEAIHWVETGNGDPVGEELADVMIRLMSAMYWYAKNYLPLVDVKFNINDFNMRLAGVDTSAQSIQKTLNPIIDLVSSATEAGRHKDYDAALEFMQFAFERTAIIAQMMGIDWLGEIMKKTRKNLSRPYLHGKKDTI